MEALNEDTPRGGLHGETGKTRHALLHGFPENTAGIRSSEKAGVIRHRHGRGMRAAALTSGKNSSRGSAHRPWNSPGQNTGVGSLSLLQGIFPTQGWNPGLLHGRRILYQLSQGKPNNTGVGSLSLLQQIFLTQESNWSLLHCRRILYQLSYQGRPDRFESIFKLLSSTQQKPSNFFPQFSLFTYWLHDVGYGVTAP